MNLTIEKIPFKHHPENGWYITITFKVNPKLKNLTTEYIDRYTDEWAYIHDFIYPEAIWSKGSLSIPDIRKRIETKDLRFHTLNPLLTKLNKDTYEFSEAIQNKGVTRGTLEDIEEMNSLTEWEEDDYYLLIKLLGTLDEYWD
jgi:hypothetical protein